MRVLLTTLCAVLLQAGAAHAADMPLKAPPLPAPYNWTGFYAGIEGGGAWGTSHHATAGVAEFSGNFDVSGGLIGGTLGYNWQWGQAVLGVEGDASYAGLTGSTHGHGPVFCPPGAVGGTCTTKLRGLETLRARLGYAWDRFMPYVTGGLALGQIYGATDPGSVNSGSTTRAGWTVGGGIEAAFAPHWTAKVEYLYADFGTDDGLFIRNPGAFSFNVSLKTNIVRAGVNYKF